MEEEMYIAQQLCEEMNHVEFFQRWMNEVLPDELGSDEVPYPGGTPSPFFTTILPPTMQALIEDKSPPKCYLQNCWGRRIAWNGRIYGYNFGVDLWAGE